MRLRWLMALLAAPAAAADCEYAIQGDVTDASGDAPLGSDLVEVAWGGEDGAWHDGLALRFREAIHTEHRIDVFLWRSAPGAADIHLQCVTLGGHEATAGHRMPALERDPTKDDCGAFAPLSPPSAITGTHWTVPWGRQPVGSADEPVCSAALVRIWHGTRLVEEAGSMPRGLLAVDTPCPHGPLPQQGICYAQEVNHTPWPVLPGMLGLLFVGRWRR